MAQINGNGSGEALVRVERPFTENSGGNSDSRARSIANLKPFKPGQTGNAGGRPKGIFRRATRKHLLAEVADGVRTLDEVVAAQIDKAIVKADTAAFVALRDTVDGRPASQDDNGGVNVGLFVELRVMGR